MNKGQLQIGLLAGVMGLIASIGVPFVWGGKIQSKNDVQDVKIETLETTTAETRQDIKELNKKIDALLWKEGINPEKLK